MRFVTECEWESGEGLSLLEQLEAYEASEATEANDAIEAFDADAAGREETREGAIELELDFDDDASDGEEQKDENDQDERHLDGFGQSRPRLFQRPHAGGGGPR